MRENIVIIGAGGFGREVAWLVERINQKNPTWNLLGFLDDDKSLHGHILNGYEVLGGLEELNNIDAYCICAIGTASVRKKVIEQIITVLPSTKFATLIDPSVEMSQLVQIGEGAIICAHSILTVNISVGNYVIINLDCSVGHDAVIGDYVTIYPSVNVSGCVQIGNECEIGTGTQIIQGKKIFDNVIIGAGATVVNNIEQSGTYVGVPARKIK